MLSPTKGFILNHHVFLAHVIVQVQWATNVPIRVFNLGDLPVTLERRRGPEGPQPPLAPSAPEPINSVCASLPSHLQVLYNESCAGLPRGDREKLAHLL